MNAINWFEIFAGNFERASRFYSAILDAQLPVFEGEGGRMAMFPCDQQQGVGGCITDCSENRAGAGGTRVYLNVEGKLDAVIDRVPNAGGEIVQPRTSIAPHGYIALIKDSEGNIVGLHSMT